MSWRRPEREAIGRPTACWVSRVEASVEESSGDRDCGAHLRLKEAFIAPVIVSGRHRWTIEVMHQVGSSNLFGRRAQEGWGDGR